LYNLTGEGLGDENLTDIFIIVHLFGSHYKIGPYPQSRRAMYNKIVEDRFK